MKINLISYHFGETGFGKYSQSLYNSLVNLRGNESIHKTHFDFESRKVKKGNGNIRIIKNDYKIPLIDNYLLFGMRNKNVLSREGYDINHILVQTLSFLNISPKIITCHDIIPFKAPQMFSDHLFNRLKYRGLKEADAIIAVSEYTKKDLINFGVNEEKIHRIYQGIEIKNSNIPKEQLCNKYGLPNEKEFILFVGMETPRKNFIRILKAFAKINNSAKNIHLIKVGIAGGKKFRKESLKIVKKLNLEKKVTFVGHVSDSELTGFYKMATLFIFPSLYEGFGRPVLEAMTCGTPVITSNTSSLPEVVGDAGIMVNPYDVNALAEAMERVLKSDKIQRVMRKNGLKRAKNFSWEKCAKETLKVYEKVLGEG